MSLRVLLALHHRIAPGGGAPGATLALGDALTKLGCRVDYFGYEHAFGADSVDSIGSAIKFPWRLASELKRRPTDFDVLDVSTGDGWVYGRNRRIGHSAKEPRTEGTPAVSGPPAGHVLNSGLPFKRGSFRPALICRSHGLEHSVDRWQRADAAAGRTKLSWKYPLYHGGYRLWEVRKSMLTADRVLLLNDFDRQLAVDELRIPSEKITLVPNGIGTDLLGLPQPRANDGPIRLASIGTWIDRKGRKTIVETATRLSAAGVPFDLLLVGTGADEVQVWADFPIDVRSRVKVVPKYRNADLPKLLAGCSVLLLLSFTEGYALALPEGMACGLAPIATDVGGARLVVTADNGLLVPAGDAGPVVDAITHWSNHPDELLAVRRRSQASVQQHGWDHVARATIDIYDQVLSDNARPVGGPSSSTLPPSRAAIAPGSAVRQKLSICICTANRPAVLRRCLLSIEQGDSLPAEVVVGDDSLDGSETAAVCKEFPLVRYVRGPRRGLCANRNVVIAAASGDSISLIDDDGEVTPDFVTLAQSLADGSDGRTIFTGDVLEDGVDRVPPSNPTFWGHFGRPVTPGVAVETVQLNCNLFPRAAFADARFDERIVYGYEDMDLCQQMLASGMRIEYRPELVNLHLPPPKSADTKKTQGQQAERARYYTSLKRYMLWQSRPIRAFAYAALAPMHQAAHHLARRRVGRALVGFGDMTWAVARALEFRRSARTPAKAGQ